MADKAQTPKTPEDPKKKPKKLTIVDANEDAVPAPAPEPTPEPTPEAPEKGDTPPLADEEELAAIAEAFADAAEETPVKEPKAKAASKKIAVIEHMEEPETPAEEGPKEEAAEPAKEEATEEPVADAEPETTDEKEAEPETEEAPATEDETLSEDEPTEEVEEAPTAPEVPPKKPLSQLTNNVPQPPKPVEEVVADIEPEKEFADDKTAHAVDDIVASESDELLAQEDAAQTSDKPVKKKFSLKTFVKNWWGNPAARWGTIVGFALLLMLIAALPASRYGILNAIGIRAKSSLVVISNESQQPLKNAQVTLAGQSATTDDSGRVTFEKLRLGKSDLTIAKRGFGMIQQTRTLGWGSNPLGSIGMTVTGTRLIFSTKDFLSGKSVAGAEAVSGDFNALSDDKGKIILAIDQNADKDLEVTIKADGYRDEKVTVKITDTGEKAVKLVADQPRVFVSKRSGKLDIYKVDADGKNESVLLTGTGKERNDLAVLQQPNGDYTAVVSTRLGARNKDGYLMSNLFIINNKTAELTKLNESERIQLVDWSGDRVVFIAVTQGASAANPSRSKLFSFQIGQPGAKQIASANYFNDATIFKGSIYYAPSSYAVPVANVKFFKVNPDGTGQSTPISSEVWNIFRSDFDTLQLSVQQDWYELKSSGSPTKLSTAPANPRSRIYRDSPDGKHSLWVDSRDGKGVLISYDVAAKKEDTLLSQSGLVEPVYWLNSTTVVYRVSDGRETADYVRSTEGGESKKLKDVTATDSSNYFN